MMPDCRGCSSKAFNRPWLKRAVVALLLGLLLVGCQPGPPPTPTLPPALDITVTPTQRSATPSPAAIPSLTASLTRQPATPAPLPTTTTARPTATRQVDQAPPAETLWVTIPSPLILATPQLPAPVVIPPEVPPDGLSPLPGRPGALPQAPENPGFDGFAVEQGASEVVVPLGWSAWWRTGPIDCVLYERLETTGPCPSIETPDLAYKRPEFTVIPAEGRWLDPPRVVGDGQAARFFCTYGICEGGYLQQVQVRLGERYVLSAQMHAWCTQNTQETYRSQLDTVDDRLNCELAVGLDPTGGLDPRSAEVIWQPIYAYDAFQLVRTPPVQAQSAVMTLYLKGRSLWALRHNDFHFDQVTFESR